MACLKWVRFSELRSSDVDIVKALRRGVQSLAKRLMAAHLGPVHATLRTSALLSDPLSRFRQALAPLGGPTEPARKRSPRFSNPPSTYLGALL